jgi:deoxyadenosine/deoxycytidine kinase
LGVYSGLIGVVGNCTAGKTTLVRGLLAAGFHAVNIAQEHSTAQRLWQRKNPDFLVCLSCTLETAQKRRAISWGQERLNDQWERLSHARAHCHLYLPTDNLAIEEVLAKTISSLPSPEVKET